MTDLKAVAELVSAIAALIAALVAPYNARRGRQAAEKAEREVMRIETHLRATAQITQPPTVNVNLVTGAGETLFTAKPFDLSRLEQATRRQELSEGDKPPEEQ